MNLGIDAACNQFSEIGHNTTRPCILLCLKRYKKYRKKIGNPHFKHSSGVCRNMYCFTSAKVRSVQAKEGGTGVDPTSCSSSSSSLGGMMFQQSTYSGVSTVYDGINLLFDAYEPVFLGFWPQPLIS
jgi:hypothetical protein